MGIEEIYVIKMPLISTIATNNSAGFWLQSTAQTEESFGYFHLSYASFNSTHEKDMTTLSKGNFEGMRKFKAWLAVYYSNLKQKVEMIWQCYLYDSSTDLKAKK